MNSPAYAEIGITTNFSFLRGGSDPRAYVHQASALGIPVIGIADHNTLAGVVRAQYFVTDRTYCEPVLAVCGEVFREVRPAAGIYVVAGLLKPEMKVEIEVTAKRRSI